MTRKILYGVQGTGQGHISRARAMAAALAGHNIAVSWLFSGRRRAALYEMEPFGDFAYRRGLSFASQAGRIQHLETVLSNKPLTFISDVLSLDLSSYDMVVTDFEPVSAWAGRRAGKQTVAIGHQYALDGDAPQVGRGPVSRWLLRHFAPADTAIGLHWQRYGPGVLPPILDLPSETTTALADENYVLVYLPFENQQLVTRWLQQLPQQRFLQYSPQLQTATLGNVTHYTANVQGFKQHLLGCRAVICNAGFELNSECLALGKPILTRPLQGQTEQLSNAESLRRLGHATVFDTLDTRLLSDWLNNLPVTLPIHFPDVAKRLASWLASGCPESPRQLADELWGQCGQSAASKTRPPGKQRATKPSQHCHAHAISRP